MRCVCKLKPCFRAGWRLTVKERNGNSQKTVQMYPKKIKYFQRIIIQFFRKIISKERVPCRAHFLKKLQ